MRREEAEWQAGCRLARGRSPLPGFPGALVRGASRETPYSDRRTVGNRSSVRPAVSAAFTSVTSGVVTQPLLRRTAVHQTPPATLGQLQLSSTRTEHRLR